MDNFTFFNPTRVEFGNGKEQFIGQHLADHGIKKVLLCYGSDRIKRDGLFSIVSKSLAEHDIPVLVSLRLLEPLGNPPPNAVKHFATVQVMELAGEIAQLGKIRNAVYEHWRHKNANKSVNASKPRHARNGHH